MAVREVADLEPLRSDCATQLAALNEVLPGDYLQPLLVEVEQQVAAELSKGASATEE